MNDGGHHDTSTTTVPRIHSAPYATTPGGAHSRRTGRPRGPSKLHLTAEIGAEIIRRVRLRMESAAQHSVKAIAADMGVSHAIIVGAIARLRSKGLL